MNTLGEGSRGPLIYKPPPESGLQRLQEHMTLLRQMLESRHSPMRGRADRTRIACSMMAKALRLNAAQARCLDMAAEFHDVGMLGLPDGLMTKQTPLTPDEMFLIRRHSEITAQLATNLFPDMPDLIETLYYHQERPDGRGPRAFNSDQIPLLAGILAVAVAIEGMTRSDQPPLTSAQILGAIQNNSGTVFLPRATEAFRDVANELLAELRNN